MFEDFELMVIGEPIRCVTCGYDLRGLREDSICPECSTPVQRSLERKTRWLRARPFLLVSMGLAYPLAMYYFAVVCRFHVQWMAYNLPGGAVVGLIWGTAAALIGWPLLQLALPSRNWWPYVLLILILMLGYGGLLSWTLVDQPNWSKSGPVDGALFLGWPLALFACIGACAALRKALG